MGQDLGVVLAQVIHDQIGAVCRCTVMLEIPAATHPDVGMPPVQGPLQIPHDPQTDSCSNAQTMLNKLPVNNSACVK